MRIASLLVTGSLLIAGAANAASLDAAIDDAVGKIMAGKKNVGAAVGVMRDGKMIFAKGYGLANIEYNAPVKPETVFRVGSITKQFTATALLMLAEEHKLSVDDKLSKYFPDFPRADEVTLRQVLNHTSGIHSYTDPKQPIDPHKDMTTVEMVHNIQAQIPLYDFEPGAKYSYSNSGYFLLGAIVEKLSGKPLAAVFKDRIFTPLGMKDTALDDVQEIVTNRASGYDLEPDHPGVFHNTTYASMTWPAGAGALRSTIGDLAKWHAALFAGKVLKPDTFRQMTTPGKLKDGAVIDMAPANPRPGAEVRHDAYAFGLAVGTAEGEPDIGHSGSIQGFNAELDTFPKSKITVVALVNTDGRGATEIERAVAKAVLHNGAPAQ